VDRLADQLALGYAAVFLDPAAVALAPSLYRSQGFAAAAVFLLAVAAACGVYRLCGVNRKAVASDLIVFCCRSAKFDMSM
jgi:hypothetical protein